MFRTLKALEKLMISISEDWISCSRINESENDSMHNVYDNGLSISHTYIIQNHLTLNILIIWPCWSSIIMQKAVESPLYIILKNYLNRLEINKLIREANDWILFLILKVNSNSFSCNLSLISYTWFC